jgi:HAD superfamily hydrolase (TIGR01549 family)
MTSNIKAIFFDIGGTLRVSHIDENQQLQNIEEMISLLGEKISPENFITKIHKGEKAYRKWCKPSFNELNEIGLWTRFILPEYPVEFIRENAMRLNQLWRESRPKYILPDMVETMRQLSKRGYKLGLISNTTSTVEGYQLLADTGLTGLFSCVILSAEIGRRKPHPSLFIEAARRAKVSPWECAYVGDRPSRDLVGARQSNYGEVVIINTERYSVDENDLDDYDPEKDSGLILRPDHYIRRLSQLLDYYPSVVKQTGNNRTSTSPKAFYDVALSTMWGVDQDMPFGKTFELVKTIGISRFELNHKVTPELFSQFGYNRHYVSTVHDPCPAEKFYDELKETDFLISSLDETRRKASVETTKRTIDLACKLGSKSVVIHPGSVMGDSSIDHHLRSLFRKGLKNTPDYESLKFEMISHRASLAAPYLEQTRKSLQEIIDHTRGSGIVLGLENRYRYYDIPLPDELDSLLSLCDEEWFGFQFDTGHAQTLHALEVVPFMEWLERFGNRMVGTHLHDVIGLTDHQTPGIGDIDFSQIAPYIPENACRTLEIGSQATLPDIAEGLEVLTKAGCIRKY